MKMTILNRWVLTLLLPAMLPWFACVKTYSTATDQSLTPRQPSQSLMDYLKNNYSFSMFYAAIQRVGLDKQLDSTKKYTILMPDDNAFALANITMDSLMNVDTAYLRKWMGFHILQGAIGYDSVPQTVDNVFYSILGQKIFLSKPVTPSQSGHLVLHANGTAVVSFDITASDGYIQVLSTPLNAPLEGTLQDYINAHPDQYSLFKAALQHFNLWDSLGTDTTKPLTVFAPVNSAFQNLLLLNIADNYNYDPYTITTDTIASWNTNTIPRDVFGVYLFPGRIFTSDFSDAPRTALYIMPDQQATIDLSSQNPLQLTGSLINYQAENQLMQGEYGVSVPAPIGSPANFVTLNGNCVFQPVSALTMVP
jgi:uncharacterized surface protein with fasciclin (FAS1) repeats